MNVTKVIRSYGYTLRKVENELGYKEGSIRTLLSRANTREDSSLSLRLLYKIADCIGCHPSEFFLDLPTTKNGVEIEHKIPIPKEKAKATIGQPVLIIKEMMREKEVSIQRLSEAIGYSYMGTRALINKPNISTNNLYKIANTLGVRITDLFGYK